MGLLLVIIGIVLAVLVSWWIGVLCIVIGLVLLVAPGPHLYGYSWYRGRRGPPPA